MISTNKDRILKTHESLDSPKKQQDDDILNSMKKDFEEKLKNDREEKESQNKSAFDIDYIVNEIASRINFKFNFKDLFKINVCRYKFCRKNKDISLVR